MFVETISFTKQIHVEKYIMGRWPEDRRSNLITLLLIFVLTPLLFVFAWWFVRR